MRDLDGVFARLTNSAFRRRFRLARREQDYLRTRGLQTVLSHARQFIAQRLAPARPVNDGKQTPFRGHPVFVAQHATATCCRSCLAKWHGIPPGRPLSDDEQSHVVAAIERWLGAQIAGGRPAEARPAPPDIARTSRTADTDSGVLFDLEQK